MSDDLKNEVMILQPAKHGFVVDVEVGTRRTQVRVFEFEVLPYRDGMCEMPKALTIPEAIARLREAMEALRESAFTEALAGSLSHDAGRAAR
jgi:hypothetical protein